MYNPLITGWPQDFFKLWQGFGKVWQGLFSFWQGFRARVNQGFS